MLVVKRRPRPRRARQRQQGARPRLPEWPTAGSATTVSAAAEAGREVKIGFITPLTGALANFGVPDKYCVERWQEAVKDGLVCGDGKNHPISFVVKDTQSDTNRASQVAADLIMNDKVDMMMACSTANTCVPAAAQCETNGCPFVSSDSPAPAWFFGLKGDPKVPFKWVYNAFWGTDPVAASFLDMWQQIPTNKVVGFMLPNNADAAPWREIWPPIFEKEGMKIVDPGAFADGLEDYTAIISQFKKEGVQVVAATMDPPDWVNFTKQSSQQGFLPVVATGGKAMLFPETCEAIGPEAYGTTCEQWWSPSFPFKSSLTGETCQELADDFSKRTGRVWTQPIAHYVVFEMAADALKRATDIEDKATISQALSTLNLKDSVFGPLNMSAPVGGQRTSLPQRGGHTLRRRPVGEGRQVPLRDQDLQQQVRSSDRHRGGTEAPLGVSELSGAQPGAHVRM